MSKEIIANENNKRRKQFAVSDSSETRINLRKSVFLRRLLGTQDCGGFIVNTNAAENTFSKMILSRFDLISKFQLYSVYTRTNRIIIHKTAHIYIYTASLSHRVYPNLQRINSFFFFLKSEFSQLFSCTT